MRIVIIANRLPYNINPGQSSVVKKNPGGLVSGLSSFIRQYQSSNPQKNDYLWIGWNGYQVAPLQEKNLVDSFHNLYHSHPVFLSKYLIEKYYNGFCNKTIWPLFHNFPSYCLFRNDYWEAYYEANKLFASVAESLLKSDDFVLIQDFHLMLLPKLIKSKFPHLALNFFLHIPFPVFEVFRLLPRIWRTELLEGMLKADVIGFHTYSYSQYFLNSVLRILGLSNELGKIYQPGGVTQVGTFPLGIDYNYFQKKAATKNVLNERKKIRRLLKNCRIILSIDRLDYTKGIINRLLGFELFLEKYQKYHKKKVLLLIAEPSRTKVFEYQRMKIKIEEIVSRINGRWGTLDWTPIRYLYKHLTHLELIAIYAESEIALITPLRDGMNLIAKEYVASKKDKKGVLILSEMTGAAEELKEAIIINPYHKEEITAAIAESLTITDSNKILNMNVMQQRLKKYDIIKWGEDILSTLRDIKEEQKKYTIKLVNTSLKNKIKENYLTAVKRLFLLDYDGTLTSFVKKYHQAAPNREISRLLETLLKDHKNKVVIISGRDKQTLSSWFPLHKLAMMAEHGAWIKTNGASWQTIKPLTNTWKDELRSLLIRFTDRVPGSAVEEKEYSLTWHYRAAEVQLSLEMAKELVSELMALTANLDVSIIQGNKVIEVKNSGVNKGSGALYFINKNTYDFILAIGDDETDEDMFAVLPEYACSIKVGLIPTRAKYSLKDQAEVIPFLGHFFD